MDKQPDYNELLKASRQGDTSAREQMFQHLRVRLKPILKYRLREWPAEEIEDILQDTLLVVSEKLDQVESNPDYFALDVLRNKIGNSIARHRRRVSLTIDPTDSGEEHERSESVAHPADLPTSEVDLSSLESAETAKAIAQAIRQLTPLCQALFTALLENRSVTETWDLFQTVEAGLKRSAFDKRLFDCRRKLRQVLARTK